MDTPSRPIFSERHPIFFHGLVLVIVSVCLVVLHTAVRGYIVLSPGATVVLYSALCVIVPITLSRALYYRARKWRRTH